MFYYPVTNRICVHVRGGRFTVATPHFPLVIIGRNSYGGELVYKLVATVNCQTDGPSLVYCVWSAGTKGTQPFTYVNYVIII